MTGLISETYWRQPPLYFSAMLLIGLMFLHRVVHNIRTGVFPMRGGPAYRDRAPGRNARGHPVSFWLHVAIFSVSGAGGLVLGAIGLGLWAWRTFGTAAPS
jgi:hypothetical protein